MSDGEVLVHRSMSLDGFIAGPEYEMDWLFEYEEPESALGVISTVGAMLAGRNTWEVGQRDTGKPSGAAYGGAWSGAEFVLTHRPPTGISERGVTFLSGDIRDVVAAAKQAAGAKLVEVLGADVAAQCLEHGLVDQIFVHILPVLLGDGVRLFPPRPGARVDLEPIGVTSSGQVASLRFRVLR
jgi:dihydrofolate reductase